MLQGEEMNTLSSDRLMSVIKDVHSRQGDDICWMDIDRIFVAAGLSVPERKVGNKLAMLANCRRFITVMCRDGEWPTYQEIVCLLRKLVNASKSDDHCLHSLAHEAELLLARIQE